MTSLKLAYLNLTRRKVPSVIAIVAISVSIACSGILLRLNIASQKRFSTLAKAGEAIVGAKAGGIEMILGALNGEGEYPGYLPMKLFESLRAGANVKFEDGAEAQPTFLKSVIPFLYFAKFKNYRVVGTDESFVHRPNSEDNPEFASGGWPTQINQIVLGSKVAQNEKLNVGDLVELTPWAGREFGKSVKFQVAGIFAPTRSSYDQMLFAQLIAAQGVLSTVDLSRISIWGPQVLNYFLIYLKPGGFDDLSALINKRTVGQAILVTEQRERLETLSGVGQRLGVFVTLLILVLSGLAVTAMLITRFDAMSLQLAVLRALGYKKREIGRWLLWEGFLIGLCACVIGIFLDLIGFPIMRELLGDALPPSDVVSVSIFSSFPVWIVALLATVSSVFIPMYRIYKQDVHFSLRS